MNVVETIEVVKQGNTMYKLDNEYSYAIPVKFVMDKKSEDFFNEHFPLDRTVSILDPFALFNDKALNKIHDIYNRVMNDKNITMEDLSISLNTLHEFYFPVIFNIDGRIFQIDDIPECLSSKDINLIFDTIFIKPLHKNIYTESSGLIYTTKIFKDITVQEFKDSINNMISDLGKCAKIVEDEDDDDYGDGIYYKNALKLYFILLFGGDDTYLDIDDIENRMYDLFDIIENED